jgi:hypothetical protein
MRPAHIFVIVVAIIISTLYMSCKPEPPKKVEVLVEIEALEEKESTWPAELQVFEPQPVDAKGTIKKVAEILRLRGKMEETDERFKVVEGSRYLEGNKISNAVFYGEMNRLWSQGPIPDKEMEFKVPDDEGAKKIANTLLQDLGFTRTDLRFITMQCEPEIFEILKPKEKEPKKVVVGKTVTVRRTLNGLPVMGPGSKIKVYIAGDGRMAGWMSVWRPFTGAPRYLVTLKPPSQPQAAKRLSLDVALEQLKEKPLEHMLIADVEEVVIKDVQLAYYEKSASERQQYLQPVYAFTGIMRGGKDTKRPFELPYQQYVLAIEKPLEALWDIGIEHKVEPRTELEIPVDQDEEVKEP